MGCGVGVGERCAVCRGGGLGIPSRSCREGRRASLTRCFCDLCRLDVHLVMASARGRRHTI